MKVDIPTLEEIKAALVKDFKRQTRLLMEAVGSPAWRVRLPRPKPNEKKSSRRGHPISRAQRAAQARGMKRYWAKRRRAKLAASVRAQARKVKRRRR